MTKKAISRVNVAHAYEMRKRALDEALARLDAGEVLHIHISKGNRKTGALPSFSVLPLLTCGEHCSQCAGWCYACKGAFCFPRNVRQLAENTALLMRHPDQVREELAEYIAKTKPEAWRWNVAGDIFSREYLDIIERLALEFPAVRFLAFTKHYERINARLDEVGEFPPSLSIVFSAWNDPAKVPNPHGLPVSMVREDGAQKVPENATACGGHCTSCLWCFFAKRGELVFFDLH